MRRGEAWWCDLGSIGTHRVILVSRDNSYRARGRATVALVTSTVRAIPVEVDVTVQLALPRTSVVNVDELYTVRTDQLRDRMGSLDSECMDAVDSALRFALGLRSS